MTAKEIFFDFIGFLLLLLFIAQAGLLILSHDYRYFVWFSNHAALIIGLAILYRSSLWITAEVAIGFVPEMVWITDFVYHIFTGKFLTGVTAYLAVLSPLQYAIALQHLLVIPLALLCLWFMGADGNGMMVAFVHGVLLWLSGYVLIPEANINCSYKSCITLLDHPAYILFWPFIALLVIFMSYGLLLLVCRKKIRENNLHTNSH